MGLDAVVFCDCVEKGRLRIPHPFPRMLYIARNGSPEIRSDNPAEIEQHDAWMRTACKHEEMIVAGASLGSAAAIAFFQDVLRRKVDAPAREFPVLWKKVIYEGTHCGDHLTIKSVRGLNEELKRFGKLRFGSLGLRAAELRYIAEFRANLARVVKAAVKVGKPIAF